MLDGKTRRAERHERAPYPTGVRWRRVNPYVEVLGRPRYPVCRERVRADDEKADVVVHERAKHVAEVDVRLVWTHHSLIREPCDDDGNRGASVARCNLAQSQDAAAILPILVG